MNLFNQDRDRWVRPERSRHRLHNPATKAKGPEFKPLEHNASRARIGITNRAAALRGLKKLGLL